MTTNTGPLYREWLELLSHANSLNFEQLQKIAKQIEAEKKGLSEGQRADLLLRLGDLQVEAAQRKHLLAA